MDRTHRAIAGQLRKGYTMKKSTKRGLIFVFAVVLAWIACRSAGAAQIARRMETNADADEWIRVFLGEEPEALTGAWEMTPQMEAAVAALGGLKGMAASLAQLGDVKEIGSAYEGELQGYKVFFVPCVFSAMPVDLVLATQDGAIAGLSTGAYSGGKEKTEETEETERQADFDSIELSLPVPSLDGGLPGTLTLPKGEGPFPAVILVHGSGPNDRDETVGSVKPFRDLAEGLAEKGIAVYRYDKRTYVFGEQMKADREITLEEETIEDAVNAAALLCAQEKIDPERIFILGHSLGGNAIPSIAEQLEQEKAGPVRACGFILMAASPRPLDVLMREQYDFLYSLQPEVTKEQQAEKDSIFRELDKLKDLDALAEDETILGICPPYWKWLEQYDILSAAEKITRPCLLLQGEEDYQVTMEDFSLWKEALGEKDNWKMISYPGLTHCFTAGQKTDGSAVYARPEKMNGQVIEDIAAFVNSSAMQ